MCVINFRKYCRRDLLFAHVSLNFFNFFVCSAFRVSSSVNFSVLFIVLVRYRSIIRYPLSCFAKVLNYVPFAFVSCDVPSRVSASDRRAGGGEGPPRRDAADGGYQQGHRVRQLAQKAGGGALRLSWVTLNTVPLARQVYMQCIVVLLSAVSGPTCADLLHDHCSRHCVPVPKNRILRLYQNTHKITNKHEICLH